MSLTEVLDRHTSDERRLSRRHKACMLHLESSGNASPRCFRLYIISASSIKFHIRNPISATDHEPDFTKLYVGSGNSTMHSTRSSVLVMTIYIHVSEASHARGAAPCDAYADASSEHLGVGNLSRTCQHYNDMFSVLDHHASIAHVSAMFPCDTSLGMICNTLDNE
jgi:hypothetical protein